MDTPAYTVVKIKKNDTKTWNLSQQRFNCVQTASKCMQYLEGTIST